MGKTQRKRTRSYNLLSSYSFFSPGLKEIILLLLLFLLGNVLGSLVLLIMMAGMDAETALTYGTPVVYPIAFIPAMIYASIKSRNNSFFDGQAVPLDRNGFGTMGGFMAAVTVSIATIALSVVIDPLNSILPDMSFQLKSTMERMLNGPLWLTLLSVSIFAPFFEEWLCRGIILRGLLDKINPTAAIICSALIFGVIHGNIWQAIPATLVGCLFGYVYYKTGSLKLTMLMHCVNNSLAVLLARMDCFKDFERYIDMFPQTWQWVVFYILCIGILVLFFSSFRRHMGKGQDFKMSDGHQFPA